MRTDYRAWVSAYAIQKLHVGSARHHRAQHRNGVADVRHVPVGRKCCFVGIDFQNLVGISLGAAAGQLVHQIAWLVRPDLLRQQRERRLECSAMPGLHPDRRDNAYAHILLPISLPPISCCCRIVPRRSAPIGSPRKVLAAPAVSASPISRLPDGPAKVARSNGPTHQDRPYQMPRRSTQPKGKGVKGIARKLPVDSCAFINQGLAHLAHIAARSLQRCLGSGFVGAPALHQCCMHPGVKPLPVRRHGSTRCRTGGIAKDRPIEMAHHHAAIGGDCVHHLGMGLAAGGAVVIREHRQCHIPAGIPGKWPVFPQNGAHHRCQANRHAHRPKSANHQHAEPACAQQPAQNHQVPP